MQPLILNPSNRLRRSPTFDVVRAAGAKAYSVYNRTLIGQWFGSLEEDYWHLKSAVQVWDVGGERVVEVSGPDAARLIQMTTPRDISRIGTDQCAYVPMVNRAGRMLNDPVMTKLSEDRFWLALADGDAALYLEGLAVGGGLQAEVSEPDVWILAIQGPKADDLAARVWGDQVREIGFFRYGLVDVGGHPTVLARSGWSVQGGFELYVDRRDLCVPIWRELMQAGEDLDVRAGCPNLIERIEGGLLSYGNDILPDHTPFEAGFARFCNVDRDTGCLAHTALQDMREPARMIRAVEIDGPKVPQVERLWGLSAPDGAPVGVVSSAAWSPGQETNVAIAMVDRSCWAPGSTVTVDIDGERRDAVVRKTFWGRPTT